MSHSIQHILRRKRDGAKLEAGEIRFLVESVQRGRMDGAQIGAFLMAVRLRGMDTEETAALTLAQRDSGRVLRWKPGAPVLDKHSTGGVGDCTSLVVAPVLAACGARVPMISGRGLGHTGGTLDKLEAIPGYRVQPGVQALRRVVAEAGCAIVGAGQRLAPADRVLYTIRDVTATVDSIPLITASILSKKLAEGLDALVLDVKTGSGAILPDPALAQALARSLAEVAARAGLSTRVLLGDMSQPLATSAGNALEVAAAIRVLRGEPGEARLREFALELAAAALVAGGHAPELDDARAAATRALDSGHAAERFAAMVTALGGPANLLDAPQRHLPEAPCRLAVDCVQDGHVQAWDTRALGEIVARLGGGRERAGEPVDHRVGLAEIVIIGTQCRRGDALAVVHAADPEQARAAAQAVRTACRIGAEAPAPAPLWQHLAVPNG